MSDTSQNPSLPELRHSLRNHLNNISVHAELAKLLSEKGNSSEQVANCIDKILAECKECAQRIGLDQ